MLVDHEIETLHNWLEDNRGSGLLQPFFPHQVRERDGQKIVSWGLSSAGYDVKLATEYKVFNNRQGGLIDPLAFDEEKLLLKEEGPFCNIAPNSYILGRTVERFNLPRTVVIDCIGKSTYARCGLIVNVTPGEPEWEGYLTLELCNGTPCPIRVYANMGIAQIRFFPISSPRVSYADRNGKYQNQEAEPITARV